MNAVSKTPTVAKLTPFSHNWLLFPPEKYDTRVSIPRKGNNIQIDAQHHILCYFGPKNQIAIPKPSLPKNLHQSYKRK